jgi:Protein of unknown function (DUF2591)
MKKVETDSLTGATLDWAVAKCENLPVEISRWGDFVLVDLSVTRPVGIRTHGDDSQWAAYRPASDWSLGGPIIEREKLMLGYSNDVLPSGAPIQWVCANPARYVKFDADGDVSEWHLPDGYGPTPLIAAMRCYVASKLGSVVKVPKELTC